jgi:hypothetical protein
MRIIFTLFVLIFATSLKAQIVPLSFMDYTQRAAYANHHQFKDSIANKKWFLTSYSGISTSFVFYKGGNATLLSAPLGLQLNKRLNNNLYAFAGVSAAPAYINFNNAFLSANINKANPNNSFIKGNNFGIYSRADLGLTYVNDAKTFSISGSIGVERSSYPLFQYNQINTTKQNPAVYPKK